MDSLADTPVDHFLDPDPVGDAPDLDEWDEAWVNGESPPPPPPAPPEAFAEWVPYRGPRGGIGWLDAEKPGGEPVYQKEKPGEGGGVAPDPDGPPAPKGDWDAPDWVRVDSKGGRPKWLNLDTGAERYGRRPLDRPDHEKQAEAERTRGRLSKPPAVGAYFHAPPEVTAAVFGSPDPLGWARALGVPDGTAVAGHVYPGQTAAHVVLDHPFADRWNRTVFAHPDGTLSASNNVFLLRPRYQGSGFGLRAFSGQVRALFAAGGREISTTAGKSRAAADRMNGYYTWARFGYDAELEPQFRYRLPKELKGAKTVQDLMATPAGRDHWLRRGYQASMSFDLTPGSASLAALDSYLATKGLPPIDQSPAAVARRGAEVAARKARLDDFAPRLSAAAAAEKRAEEMNRAASRGLDGGERFLRRTGADAMPWAREARFRVGDRLRELYALAERDPADWTPEAVERAVVNAYSYHADALRREHFAGQWRSPAAQPVHGRWGQWAHANGLDPAELRREAERHAHPDPDPAAAVSMAYEQARLALTRPQREAFRGHWLAAPTDPVHNAWARKARGAGVSAADLNNAAMDAWNGESDPAAAVDRAYRETWAKLFPGREAHAERFAEPTTPEVALAGPDGRRAVELLSAAEKTGRDLLGDLVARGAARLLRETGGDPHRVAAAQVLFDDAELDELADNLSATIATADLLGRVRVRERARLAAEAVQTFAEAPDPFAAFADPVRVQPPALAVEHFRRLVPSLDRSLARYGPLLDRHAFTLAAATDQVLLEKVKAAVLAQLEGQTGDATPDVQAILDAAGVSPRNPQYADMVVRTNVLAALNEGAQAELADPEMQAEFPWWRYEGIRDGRQGEDHEPKFDRYYPAAVTFNEVRGPRVWNCRCSMTPVHRSEVAELVRRGVRVESRW